MSIENRGYSDATFRFLLIALFVYVSFAPEQSGAYRPPDPYETQLAAERLKKNRVKIVAGVKEYIAKKEYAGAAKVAEPYVSLDAELAELYAQAREQVLLGRVHGTEFMDTRTAGAVYTELKRLRPGNKKYAEKADLYSKIFAKEEKERTDFLNMAGEKPQPSAWDGSFRAVKDYLALAANDPSSISIEGCKGPYKSKNGWLVACAYRGKNAFGALVKNANWFVIRHGNVVKMEPITKYEL